MSSTSSSLSQSSSSDVEGFSPTCPDGLAGLVDVELHAIKFLQQIVGELDIGLVDLIDQQYRPLFGHEGVPQLAALDIVANVPDPFVAELAITQARHGVVLVKPLQGLGR